MVKINTAGYERQITIQVALKHTLQCYGCLMKLPLCRRLPKILTLQNGQYCIQSLRHRLYKISFGLFLNHNQGWKHHNKLLKVSTNLYFLSNNTNFHRFSLKLLFLSSSVIFLSWICHFPKLKSTFLTLLELTPFHYNLERIYLRVLPIRVFEQAFKR